MNFHFKLVPTGQNQIQVEVEVSGSHTFLDLHQALQNVLGTPDCQMASFFVFDQNTRRKTEVSQVEPDTRPAHSRTMRKTRLGSLITPSTPFVRYVYDLFDDRSLTLELTGINMEKNHREPVARVNGSASQVDILDEIIPASSTAAEFSPNSDYGMLDDYYEVFGDIEELSL